MKSRLPSQLTELLLGSFAACLDAKFVRGGDMQGLNPMRQAAMLRVNNGYQVPTRAVPPSVLRRCISAGDPASHVFRFLALTRVLCLCIRWRWTTSTTNRRSKCTFPTTFSWKMMTMTLGTGIKIRNACRLSADANSSFHHKLSPTTGLLFLPS